MNSEFLNKVIDKIKNKGFAQNEEGGVWIIDTNETRRPQSNMYINGKPIQSNPIQIHKYVELYLDSDCYIKDDKSFVEFVMISVTIKENDNIVVESNINFYEGEDELNMIDNFINSI